VADQPSYHLFGNVLTFRARPSQGSPFLLTEARSAPGAGAPPNRHAGDGEAFYILAGTYAFSVDGQDRVVGAGDYVPIPTGAPHAFRNVGEGEARMLILNWPGHQHEAFFSGLGEAVPPGFAPVTPPGPPPEAALAEIRRRSAACGVELLV
jgi:quercetin dioxygenase-like cupin family protein